MGEGVCFPGNFPATQGSWTKRGEHAHFQPQPSLHVQVWSMAHGQAPVQGVPRSKGAWIQLGH